MDILTNSWFNSHMTEVLPIFDQIYGVFNINEPVLINLITSPTVQRLNGISQGGLPSQFDNKDHFSRFKHVAGTMLLVKEKGSSIDEQAAALLHDVSHTACSHLIDWIINKDSHGAPNEDYQDNIHEDFINKSELPEILNRHGLDPQPIIHYEDQFKLLEQPLPELCADRVDYSLREFPLNFARNIYQNIVVEDGQLVCRNYRTAALYAREFLKLQTNNYGSDERVTRYYYMASAFKRAIYDLGEMTLEDFNKDDEYVYQKIIKVEDQKIENILDALRQPDLPIFPGEKIQLPPKKFRYIDPLFLNRRKQLERLSEVDEEFKELLSKAKEKNSQGTWVPKL